MQVPVVHAVSRLTPSNCVLMICDLQEKFIPLIYRSSTIVQTCRYMTSVAATMQIPMICTQQYTKVFGPTINDCFATPEIQTLATTPIYEKKKFSMITDEVREKLDTFPPQRTTYILVGIEAHVCLQQTCLDLLQQQQQQQQQNESTTAARAGAAVYIIADAMSSQQPMDRHIAIQRMVNAGAILTTAQSAVFELMATADYPQFKTISKLTVEHMKLPNEFNSDFT